jgi:hypothetical protein
MACSGRHDDSGYGQVCSVRRLPGGQSGRLLHDDQRRPRRSESLRTRQFVHSAALLGVSHPVRRDNAARSALAEHRPAEDATRTVSRIADDQIVLNFSRQATRSSCPKISNPSWRATRWVVRAAVIPTSRTSSADTMARTATLNVTRGKAAARAAEANPASRWKRARHDVPPDRTRARALFSIADHWDGRLTHHSASSPGAAQVAHGVTHLYRFIAASLPLRALVDQSPRPLSCRGLVQSFGSFTSEPNDQGAKCSRKPSKQPIPT